MLAPECWQFSPSPSRCNYKRGSVLSESTHCKNLINTHYFNYLISVTVPDEYASDIIVSLSRDNDYYLVKNIGIDELINKTFIDSFVKKGQLSILSDNTHIDTDDCIALIPSGHLILSLQTETFQELGLEGKPSFFSQKKPTRFVVDLDLLAEQFSPGKKNYDRTLTCLTDRLDQKFNLLVAWEPPEEKVCPSSIAAYLSSRGFIVSVCKPQFKKRMDNDILVPLLGAEDKVDSCTSEELVEWLGAYTIGADLHRASNIDDYLSSYRTPAKNQLYSHVVTLQWSGFFTVNQIQRLFNEIERFTKFREGLIPWSSMFVQGFADSPVSWGQKEHQFYTKGDNNYVIFQRPDDYYMTYSILGSSKRPCSKYSSKSAQ